MWPKKTAQAYLLLPPLLLVVRLPPLTGDFTLKAVTILPPQATHFLAYFISPTPTKIAALAALFRTP